MKLISYLALSIAVALMITSVSIIKTSYNGNLVCYDTSNTIDPNEFNNIPRERGWPATFVHNQCSTGTTIAPNNTSTYKSGFKLTAYLIDIVFWGTLIFTTFMIIKVFRHFYSKNKWRTIVLSIIITVITLAITFLVFSILVGQALSNMSF